MLQAALSAREQKLAGDFVVARKDLPVELTPFGYVRWYLHPDLTDRNTTALYFFEIAIPPHSKTGKFRHQGGVAAFVVAGTGYAHVNQDEYHWKPTDMLGMPTLPDGVVVQFFNSGATEARIIVSFPNFDSALGPELGVAMEILEPCPEFGENVAS
jgi:gentisate 1,2-dioxygenase